MRSRFFAFIVGCLVFVLPSLGHAALPAPALIPVPFNKLSDQTSFAREVWQRRGEILRGIDHSLRYLRTPNANEAYRALAKMGISRARVERSLIRFRSLLLNETSHENLRQHLVREFTLFRSVGNDGHGTVRFTGYYQPTYRASRVRTGEYSYPIFRLPPAFTDWHRPHPSRVALEGFDGRGGSLRGLELAWLRSRYEAFMIHVQGSAILEMPDRSRMAVGYAANTDYRFVGFTRQCLQNRPASMSVQRYFEIYPEELHRCLSRNNRFIFFKENPTPSPIGALGVPVTAECSIATDKRAMPPGALGLIRTLIPYQSPSGAIFLQPASRIVLDQDAGGAIKGPGRVDLFMGTGHEAGRKASSVTGNGELYYLIIKDDSDPPAEFQQYANNRARSMQSFR